MERTLSVAPPPARLRRAFVLCGRGLCDRNAPVRVWGGGRDAELQLRCAVRAQGHHQGGGPGKGGGRVPGGGLAGVRGQPGVRAAASSARACTCARPAQLLLLKMSGWGPLALQYVRGRSIA